MAAEPDDRRLKALGEIRDYVIMLSLGNAYLCEDPILIKIGQKMDLILVRLKEEILALKKRFPGQFMEEVNTDEILEEIGNTAQRLQEPDKEIGEQCTVGALGKNLEDRVNLLAGAVKEIQKRVEGESQAYRGKDLVSRHLTGLKYSVQNFLVLMVKIVIILALLILLPLSYLFITMETEGTHHRKIAKAETYIQTQKKALSDLELDQEELSRKIRALNASDRRLSRLDEVEKIELDVQLHQLKGEINRVELDIEVQQKKIEESRERIQEIKKKTLIQKLLRR